jgi:hypothetical protein
VGLVSAVQTGWIRKTETVKEIKNIDDAPIEKEVCAICCNFKILHTST